MNNVKFNDPSHPALMKYQSEINNEAEIAGVPPCLLAAIVARETGGQNEFQIGMPKGDGCGCGLTQITAGVNWTHADDPTYDGYHLMNPADNLYVAAAYFLRGLISNATRAQRDNPAAFNTSCKGQIVYAAAAGYNGGWGCVQAAMFGGYDCDERTTNGYATDVLQKYTDFVNASLKNVH